MLGVAELDYLGHHVSASGIQQLQEWVRVVAEFPQPANTQQLQSFLGMVNFYRRFIAGAAGILKPVTDALKGDKKAALVWAPPLQAAFQAAKAALAASVQLAFPR